MAGLGRADEARREAQWLEQSAVYRNDAWMGTEVAVDRARILAQIGDAGGALDEVERLLAQPSGLSIASLRLDPLWDPIRNSPRFQLLLQQGGP
jgi:serine/threonine-protein kinase